MKLEISQLAKGAFDDFRRNKVRTFLTSLGITIGILSVLMLISLGIGLRNYLQQQFESLGANMVIIMPGSALSEDGGGFSDFRTGILGGASFDERDARALARIREAKHVAPATFTQVVIEAGGQKARGSIMGSNEDIFPVLNTTFLSGNAFTRGDNQSRAKVAVLGESLAENLFDNPSRATGQSIRVNSQRFRVVGVIEGKGDNEIDNAVFMPYRTAFVLTGDRNFFSIYMIAQSSDSLDVLKEQAKNVLADRYEDGSFSVVDQTQILSTVNQIFAVVNGILIAIGSISLVVGGIGIMNIMYATVTERTKEVGIRRAVGATKKDILLQFLSEAVILSLFGGLVGLGIATAIVIAVSPFFPLGLNILAVVITLAISSAIGIFFGVFPARRAANLAPIEAIRYE